MSVFNELGIRLSFFLRGRSHKDSSPLVLWKRFRKACVGQNSLERLESGCIHTWTLYVIGGKRGAWWTYFSFEELPQKRNMLHRKEHLPGAPYPENNVFCSLTNWTLKSCKQVFFCFFFYCQNSLIPTSLMWLFSFSLHLTEDIKNVDKTRYLRMSFRTLGNTDQHFHDFLTFHG